MTEPTAPERPEEAKTKRPAWVVWAVAGALLAGGLAAAFLLLGGGDDTTEAGGLDADLVLQLQTLCFESDPPLFYDDQGYCYPVDPNTLSGDALIAARVLPNSAAPADADLTASGSGTPAAPAATTPAAPAATTPTAPAATTPTAPAATTPTEAPLPPINLGQTGGTGWSWNLAFPASARGVDCIKDAEDKYPPGCQDAYNGGYTVNFSVANGAVNGSATSIPSMGSKKGLPSGSISPSGTVSMSILVGAPNNLGTWILNGTLSEGCSISGSYYHELTDTRGGFTLQKQTCS
jgi:hypothetical protein